MSKDVKCVPVRVCVCVCVLTAEIPDEQLRTCGVADCGLVVQGNSTTTRPARELVNTLLGCYIGNVATVLEKNSERKIKHTVIRRGESHRPIGKESGL